MENITGSNQGADGVQKKEKKVWKKTTESKMEEVEER